MDATGEGSHTSVCMRSSKPFVLCWDVEKATLRCLLIMQNLQRSSLHYLIPSRAFLLCRTWRPRSLKCPRCICQSLVVSFFSVVGEASPIIMLHVNLYKFVVRFPLRIVMKPLVTLIASSAPENLYPRASNERRFFFKFETCRTFVRVRICPSNILIRMLLMPTVLHRTSLPIRTEPSS